MARSFVWDATRERAYALSQRGRWTERSARGVGETLGVSRRTVEGWRRRTAWRERARLESEERRARRQAEQQAEMERFMAEYAAEVAALDAKKSAKRRMRGR